MLRPFLTKLLSPTPGTLTRAMLYPLLIVIIICLLVFCWLDVRHNASIQRAMQRRVEIHRLESLALDRLRTPASELTSCTLEPQADGSSMLISSRYPEIKIRFDAQTLYRFNQNQWQPRITNLNTSTPTTLFGNPLHTSNPHP